MSDVDPAPADSGAAPKTSKKKKEAPPLDPKAPVVLFDGVCNFCNGAIQFIVDHEKEREPRIRFTALQSEVAPALLEKAFGKAEAERLQKGADGAGDPDSVVLIEDGRGYTHSAAGLRIARHLRAPWSWAFVFVIVPAFVRDWVYRFIARNRYRWFGKTETCRVPTPELRARFLA